MPTLNLPEVALWYEDDGAGPPLFLIAGMASDSASWMPLLPLLTGDARVIRPDNRTTGRTVPVDAPTDVTRNAADCVALMDHLGIGSAHVLGHSMGGLIAMELAAAYPGRVRSLTLAASAPMRSSRNIALFDALISIRRSNAPSDTWLRAFFPWLFSHATYDTPQAVDVALAGALGYPHAQSVDAMERQLRALDTYDPSTVALDVPTQALLAGRDLLIPQDMATKALSSVGVTDITLIPNAGHSIHWDAPAAVAAALLGFVQETA